MDRIDVHQKLFREWSRRINMRGRRLNMRDRHSSNIIESINLGSI